MRTKQSIKDLLSAAGFYPAEGHKTLWVHEDHEHPVFLHNDETLEGLMQQLQRCAEKYGIEQGKQIAQEEIRRALGLK